MTVFFDLADGAFPENIGRFVSQDILVLGFELKEDIACGLLNAVGFTPERRHPYGGVGIERAPGVLFPGLGELPWYFDTPPTAQGDANGIPTVADEGCIRISDFFQAWNVRLGVQKAD
ncbi:MAG: hypothetical protein IPJ98_02610 [Bryobacterales bacterium]|nr:hypothetical protein [Bryobacterales bacterium]